MDSKKPLYKSKTFWALGLFLLHSALGFFAVPYFIKNKLTQIVSIDLNSTMNLDEISFNPYTLTTSLTHIELTDIDQQAWFSSNKVSINFSLIDTLFGNIKLSHIKLDNPHYYLLLTDNIKKPIKYPQIRAKQTNQSEIIEIDIGNIEINQGSLSYLDQSTDHVIELKFKSVGFKHIDFSTDDMNSQFDLSLITEEEDEITLSGQFNFAKMSVSGDWNLHEFSTQTLFKFITDNNNQFYGLENQSGSIEANGQFDYDIDNQALPNLSIASLQLSNFKTKELESKLKQPQIAIPSLLINKAELDLNDKKLSINSIASDDINLIATFGTDNQIIWDALETTNQQASTADQNWQITIDQINANQTHLKLKKNKDNSSTENTLLVTTAKITNLNNMQNQEALIDFSMVLDESGNISVNSTLQIEPFKVKSQVNANLVNLKSAQAWIPSDIKLTIESGLLSLSQIIEIENNHYSSTGWAKLDELDLLDENNQTFLKITQLEFSENNIDSATKTINLNNIKLDQAEGDLSISSDNKLNINGIVANQQEKQKIKDEIKDAKNDWTINIKQIELIDLKTSFIDRSIKPSFQSKLSKVNGSIQSLSSANTSKADVDLNGILDTYGKFEIKGKINPLSDKAYTDLNININNLDLQNFSTYSSKYIGFPINRGKADFALKYKLNQSLLKGINDLSFKQLQLGDKITSKDAINLPLKLAISLLTNSKGIMKINLPVSGRVDDPDFSYGGLVFKAFFKLITGIVASPFKILGKLIPNGADLDMSGIQFQAGTIQLIAGEEEKLKAMKTILQKRPSLILELSSTINTIEDNKALKEILLLNHIGLTKAPDFSDIKSLKPIKKTYKALLNTQQWQTLESNYRKDGVLNHSQLSETAWNQLLGTFTQQAKNQLEIIGKQRSHKILETLIEDYRVPEKRLFLKPTENSEELTPQVKFGIAN